VVSNEEVAVGRIGRGGAWGSTSRIAGLPGPAPQKGRIRTLHWHKIKQKCRSLGCGLQFGGAENYLLAIRLQNSSSNSSCLVLWSKDAMRVSHYFERSCPEQRPRAPLKPQAPRASPTRAGPGPRAPPPRSSREPRESWSRGRGMVANMTASGKLQGSISVVGTGKAVLTLRLRLHLGFTRP
jgi:hypothetical protein